MNINIQAIKHVLLVDFTFSKSANTPVKTNPYGHLCLNTVK